jgi:hypothetical protein
MIMDREAFVQGYMSKTANAKDLFTWARDNAVLLGASVPVLAGLSTGALTSAVTSPSKLDQKTLQKKLHALELKEYRTELERRKAIAKKQGINESSEEVSTGRSLRI